MRRAKRLSLLIVVIFDVIGCGRLTQVGIHASQFQSTQDDLLGQRTSRRLLRSDNFALSLLYISPTSQYCHFIPSHLATSWLGERKIERERAASQTSIRGKIGRQCSSTAAGKQGSQTSPQYTSNPSPEHRNCSFSFPHAYSRKENTFIES